MPPLATNDRLEKAVAAMRAGAVSREKEVFALPENRFHRHKRKADELAARRHVKRFVKPDNASTLTAQLPEIGDVTHSVLRGDFVLGDALPTILAKTGHCPHLQISTLALSRKNAETLRDLVTTGRVGRLSLICSHYFRAVDKTSTFHAIRTVLKDCAALKVARCHAKIILLPAGDNAFVFEGSANLRSSDTIEQLTIFNDQELLAFHSRWMDELAGNVDLLSG